MTIKAILMTRNMKKRCLTFYEKKTTEDDDNLACGIFWECWRLWDFWGMLAGRLVALICATYSFCFWTLLI